MSRFKSLAGKTGRAGATIVLAMGLAFTPAAEGIACAKDKGAEVQKKILDLLSSKKLKGILGNVNGGTTKEKVESLFTLLKVGNGVLKADPSDFDKRPPRTIDETLEEGGDCTEFALVVLASLKELGIEGGAMVVHFEGSNALTDHIFAYASVGGKKIIIDPQAKAVGKLLKNKKYKLLMDVTPEQATAMYYRETGEYLSKKGKTDEAIKNFEKATELNPRDAYSHHMLGILYEQKGNKKKAEEHHTKAAELQPDNKVYQKNVKAVDINKELQLAQEAIDKEDWDGCIEHYENVLNSGVKLSKKQKEAIKYNLDLCKKVKGN
jgi:tetratricopeptide (TPR) repeat protein